MLGEIWPAARSGLNLRTRRGKIVSHPLLIERDEAFVEVLVPAKEYPAVIMFPELPHPRIKMGGSMTGAFK